jgi:hypothetical protein
MPGTRVGWPTALVVLHRVVKGPDRVPADYFKACLKHVEITDGMEALHDHGRPRRRLEHLVARIDQRLDDQELRGRFGKVGVEPLDQVRRQRFIRGTGKNQPLAAVEHALAQISEPPHNVGAALNQISSAHRFHASATTGPNGDRDTVHTEQPPRLIGDHKGDFRWMEASMHRAIKRFDLVPECLTVDRLPLALFAEETRHDPRQLDHQSHGGRLRRTFQVRRQPDLQEPGCLLTLLDRREKKGIVGHIVFGSIRFACGGGKGHGMATIDGLTKERIVPIARFATEAGPNFPHP